mgnify:CR=1 FL=1
MRKFCAAKVGGLGRAPQAQGHYALGVRWVSRAHRGNFRNTAHKRPCQQPGGQTQHTWLTHAVISTNAAWEVHVRVLMWTCRLGISPFRGTGSGTFFLYPPTPRALPEGGSFGD